MDSRKLCSERRICPKRHHFLKPKPDGIQAEPTTDMRRVGSDSRYFW